MDFQQTENKMDTRSVPECYLCGSKGIPLYEALQDRILDSPGEWDIKKCSNTYCGLIWLDPSPTEEDIGKAYQSYYTHQGPGESPGWRKFLLRTGLKAAAQFLLWIMAISKEQDQLASMYLNDLKPGRLLEVGCGSGKFLNQMRSKGWLVEGVDLDSQAIEAARANYGVNVYNGRIEEMNYPSDSFDAVTMNHVIEHVHDPIALLRECHRILKPGGYLVIVTPNFNSWGHRKFGCHWRDLDPPRHLYLFSQKLLRECASRAGFKDSKTKTVPVNAWRANTGSLYIKATGKYSTEMSRRPRISIVLKALNLHFAELRAMRQDADLGEEAVLFCRKE